ncbi:NADP-dependent oxidoreductase [Nonomuraea sp. SMC257]|uniref:NADP-dependent oxidoreductase n=1 Tax=Nonomuraea montanisoli TaxID=2741721 RepID=A0A7Y6I3V7_9ACTN|nr:NADP-dependent oxidoreductase [Nonomuraea montanisoli]NUW30966.1 NADP-dependent oxidoreductase [Nonomuraea montanisoli]
MRAVGFTSFGDPGVLAVAEAPLPRPEEGQVRIRVEAATVNPADVAARSGAFGPMLPAGPRYVLGWDVAGTVDAVGPATSGFTPGDRVVGMSDWLATRNGTHAEFVVLDAAAVAPAPAGVDPAEAATLTANALTAVQALDLLGLVEGQTLAVTGAAGAVGGYAVELARHRGLDVIGIGSAQDEDFVSGLGATFLPRSDDPGRALRAIAPEGVDGLLDTAVIGAQVLAAVRDGGAFVSVMPPATPPAERGIRVETVFVRSDGARLRELVALVEQGRLTLRLARTLPFEQAAEAHELLAKGGLRGRLVLVP